MARNKYDDDNLLDGQDNIVQHGTRSPIVPAQGTSVEQQRLEQALHILSETERIEKTVAASIASAQTQLEELHSKWTGLKQYNEEILNALSDKYELSEEAKDKIRMTIEEEVRKAVSNINSSVDSQVTESLGEIRKATNRIPKMFRWAVGSITWAVIMTAICISSVSRCSSAKSDRDDIAIRMDSLKAESDFVDLNSDILWDFIQHDNKTRTSFESWQKKSKRQYQRRYTEIEERKDSIDKLLKDR